MTDTTASAPLVSIIVLTFNQLAYTRACLESLRRHTTLPYELILVDNASADGTPEYLCRIPGARVVLNARNRGFAGGCNQGLALMHGQHALLLNNDTLLPPGWLEHLLAPLVATPAAGAGGPIGIVGPRSNVVAGIQLVPDVPYTVEPPDPHRPDQLPAGMTALNAYAAARAQAQRGRCVGVDRVIGFCMLIRREVVARIGGLDERFGSGNFEDDDYCLRARLAGFRIVVADDCFVHHYGGRTFAGNRIDYRRSLTTSWAIFRQKWHLQDASLERGYRAGPLLARPFDPARDFCPLPDPPDCLTVPGQPLPAIPAASATVPGRPRPATPAASRIDAPQPVVLPGVEDGKRLLATGDVAGARRALAAATRAAPQAAEAWYFLGCAALAAGDPAAAVDALRQASTLDPLSADVHTALGAALREAGDLAAAQATLLRAIELDPRSAEAWYQLGAACAAGAQHEAARGALNQALRLDPTHTAARESLDAL